MRRTSFERDLVEFDGDEQQIQVGRSILVEGIDPPFGRDLDPVELPVLRGVMRGGAARDDLGVVVVPLEQAVAADVVSIATRWEVRAVRRPSSLIGKWLAN
ncbi:hypothetical protein [Streptomyces sp. LN590]|uniref:hypothetical protein n=1 Tax=Streptomyces sp. LN590 TaxID=3112980 RepID=UPI0037173AB4